MIGIGDTHGIRPVFEIIDKHKFENENLIHVGDLGLGFESIERDIKNLQLLDEALMDTNNKFYCIRGNHDNPIFWKKSLGLNLPKFHNLFLMDDYDISIIENKKVLFVGGAISIDRRPRMYDLPWPTWWKNEIFTYNEEDKMKLDHSLTNVYYNKIDLVVTHTSPDFCYPLGCENYLVNSYHTGELLYGKDLKSELDEERATVTRLYNDLVKHYKIKPKKWVYGHFHNSKTLKINDTEFILLNINETKRL